VTAIDKVADIVFDFDLPRLLLTGRAERRGEELGVDAAAAVTDRRSRAGAAAFCQSLLLHSLCSFVSQCLHLIEVLLNLVNNRTNSNIILYRSISFSHFIQLFMYLQYNIVSFLKMEELHHQKVMKPFPGILFSNVPYNTWLNTKFHCSIGH